MTRSAGANNHTRIRCHNEACGGDAILVDDTRRCTKCGTTEDSGGWRNKVWMWNWHRISLDGWPGWDLIGVGTDPQPHPPFVRLTIVKGHDRPSRKIALEWDDLAEGRFYYRDWTQDGLPFVHGGETYFAGFWFQKRTDAVRFAELYGGAVE